MTQPKKRKIAWTQTENYDISFDPEKETRESVENVVTQLGVLLLEPKCDNLTNYIQKFYIFYFYHTSKFSLYL